MIYTCKDCSYRGETSGQAGACLACGSHNLKTNSREVEKPKPGKLRMALLAGLWIYLIALIVWKLYH